MRKWTINRYRRLSLPLMANPLSPSPYYLERNYLFDQVQTN
ncbi:unnamed protein product, partial [Allacma fusca]